MPNTVYPWKKLPIVWFFQNLNMNKAIQQCKQISHNHFQKSAITTCSTLSHRDLGDFSKMFPTAESEHKT